MAEEVETGSQSDAQFDEQTATLAPFPTLPSNARQWGDFQLLQRLGQGGFGEVYRAWDPILEREVALKLLLPRGLDADQEFSSIVAEARAIARVRHANIVSVYGVDRRDGRVGFWSDYIRGHTLSGIVEAQGPLDAEETARIGIALCEALAAVHAAGLLHRDIKASNAMRDESGRVLLMDFGLSLELSANRLSESSSLAGTPRYMAPELLKGSPASIQTDLYAIGVLLHFLLTGAYASASPTRVPDPIREALEAVIHKAVDPDPRQRFLSAARLGEALDRALKAQPQLSAPPPPAAPVPAPTRSSLRRFAWAALPLCAALAFTPPVRNLFRSRASGASPAAYQDYLSAEDALDRYDRPGNTALAISLFQKTLQQTPDFALAQAGLARADWRMYLDTSDPSWLTQANQASSRALALKPSLAPVQMTAGALNVEQGKFDLGLEELQKALQLDGRSADVHAALGEAFRQQGRLDEARTELQSAIDLEPAHWRWPYLLGALDLDLGDLKSAREQFTASLEKAPDNARVLYNLGVVDWKQNRLPEAQAELQKAIQLAPTTQPVMALGSVFIMQADYPQAVEAFKRAVHMNAGSWEAWGDLAEACEWAACPAAEIADAYAKAIQLALEQEKVSPQDPHLISRLGAFYASLHQEKQALPLLRKSLLLAPKNPDILQRVGTSYEILGQRQEALTLLTQAFALGFSADFARKNPALRALRKDPDAPPQIRD